VCSTSNRRSGDEENAQTAVLTNFASSASRMLETFTLSQSRRGFAPLRKALAEPLARIGASTLSSTAVSSVQRPYPLFRHPEQHTLVRRQIGPDGSTGQELAAARHDEDAHVWSFHRYAGTKRKRSRSSLSLLTQASVRGDQIELSG
jgi:hypothetical protein